MIFNLSKYSQLKDYKEKRNFSKTPEPEDSRDSKPQELESKQQIFLVQRHQALKAGLHYDLRLEEGGVLKSWAVRKGMPNKGEKHLAIQVQDHPTSYSNFEGTIPSGYGAGEVKIDAKSTYKTIDKDGKKWKFEVLDGKYKGKWVLVNTGGNKWLLMQGKED